MFSGAVLGTEDGDQFNFLKLMLADQAFGVASRRACLGTETGCQCGQPDRQCALLQNLFTYAIGQRYFGGRNEPAAIGSLEIVFRKFWQLPCSK